MDADDALRRCHEAAKRYGMPYETALCSLQRGVLHESTIYLEHAKGELDRLHALADAEEEAADVEARAVAAEEDALHLEQVGRHMGSLPARVP